MSFFKGLYLFTFRFHTNSVQEGFIDASGVLSKDTIKPQKRNNKKKKKTPNKKTQQNKQLKNLKTPAVISELYHAKYHHLIYSQLR